MSNEQRIGLSVQSRDDSGYKLLTPRLQALDSCRVLVVDDDPLVRARLAALLNASLYDVEIATSGEEALRILDATHCHIVLTDWQMPDMDGLTLCRHIRLRHHESYIYVVMLTVRDTEHDVMRGLAAGADDYVVKGATIDDILARLEIGRRITYDNSSLRMPASGNQRVANTDPVAGTHDLGYLMQYLPRELARSQRYGHALAILDCDIEGFGRFNDRFGQGAGNELSRRLVAAANDGIREGDWLARTNGAAFMIVLPETTAKGAHCAAHRLRPLFAQHLVPTAAVPIGFTVRIGVTAVDATHNVQSAAQIAAVLRAADRGTRGDEQLGAQAGADTLTYRSGSPAKNGGKNGLN